MNDKNMYYIGELSTITYHKIKNGSKFTFGGELSTVELKVNQHFNWFQKLMWKWCFGIKIEDYSDHIIRGNRANEWEELDYRMDD